MSNRIEKVKVENLKTSKLFAFFAIVELNQTKLLANNPQVK